MPVVNVYDFDGNKVAEQELSEFVFNAPVHMTAVHRVVVAQGNCKH